MRVLDPGRKIPSLVTKKGRGDFFLNLGMQPGYLSHLNLGESIQDVGVRWPLLIGFNKVL